MSYRELIQSLRKDGEESVNNLWTDVRAEAEKIRSEASRKIDDLKSDYKKREERAVMEQDMLILSEAKKKADRIRLKAEKALSDRIYPVALSLLHELRDRSSDDLFASLVREIPAAQWKEVRINPRDAALAQRHFPDSRIVSDEKITAGMEVVSADGKICVINSLEKRLERSWEDMLPLLIKEARESVSGNEAS